MGEFMPSHILLVIIVILILFGPSRLPQLGQSLGKAIRGFKDGVKDVTKDETETKTTPSAPAQQLQSTTVQKTAEEQKQNETIKS